MMRRVQLGYAYVRITLTFSEWPVCLGGCQQLGKLRLLKQRIDLSMSVDARRYS